MDREIHMVAIGSELISGWVQDLNTSWVAAFLQEQGYKLTSSRVIGDNKEELIRIFEEAETRGGIFIVTGGLGPTADDITRFAAAEAFGLKLALDEKWLKHLQDRFAGRGMDMPLTNEIQAQFPEGALVLDNPVGTAAGFMIKRFRAALIFLPGVPRELKEMFAAEVMPIIRKEAPEAETIGNMTLKLFGLSEARVGEIVSAGLPQDNGLTVSYLPRFPEIHLVLRAVGKDEAAVQTRLFEAEQRLTELLGDVIFSRDGSSIEAVVGRLLLEQKKRLAVAESCTGGLIANRITDVAGSSRYFDCGVTTYSNESKVRLLGIPEDVVLAHGAVSEEVARAMASGVRGLQRSDYGIGVTGIAGPDGGTAEKPVGTVYIALNWGAADFCRRFAFVWDRWHNKLITSTCALEILRRRLSGVGLNST